MSADGLALADQMKEPTPLGGATRVGTFSEQVPPLQTPRAPRSGVRERAPSYSTRLVQTERGADSYLHCSDLGCTMTAWRLGSRQPLRWTAITYGVNLRMVGAIVAGWLAAALLARVGLPRVNPTLQPVPRPLETLGTVMICLPASLHATLLRDHASWLTAVSPRSPARLRFRWLFIVVVAGFAFALAWSVTLPTGVPALNAFGLWVLVSSCAVAAVVFIRHDLAVILPLILIAAFSIGGRVPFDINVVYNVERTDTLLLCAAMALVAASISFVLNGDHRDRKDS